eukprot:TRINITY_DN37026_c0_g1_i1.p1 TRINITY_DN37026_c0_g1~~TRINITY_DN37026_c0_g1_i1.p1  ORF type:complete len:239 (-),score=63.96 TRINITY_DN37026_c0_g1_i1:229-945(-)
MFFWSDGSEFAASNILYSQALNPNQTASTLASATGPMPPASATGSDDSAKQNKDKGTTKTKVPKEKVAKTKVGKEKQTKKKVDKAPADQLSAEDLAKFRKECHKDGNLKVIVERRPKLSGGGWIVCLHNTQSRVQLSSVRSNSADVSGLTLSDVIASMNSELKAAISKEATIDGAVQNPVDSAAAATQPDQMQHVQPEPDLANVTDKDRALLADDVLGSTAVDPVDPNELEDQWAAVS